MLENSRYNILKIGIDTVRDSNSDSNREIIAVFILKKVHWNLVKNYVVSRILVVFATVRSLCDIPKKPDRGIPTDSKMKENEVFEEANNILYDSGIVVCKNSFFLSGKVT